MRRAWFDHVSKTRKRLSKGKKESVTHRTAMAAASSTWPKEKEKVQRKIAREAKKAAATKAKENGDSK